MNYEFATYRRILGAKLGKEWRFRRHILDEWIDASIFLSKGGFNLLLQSSMIQYRRSGLSEDEMNRIMQETME